VDRSCEHGDEPLVSPYNTGNFKIAVLAAMVQLRGVTDGLYRLQHLKANVRIRAYKMSCSARLSAAAGIVGALRPRTPAPP
jgi:hypothetical protein